MVRGVVEARNELVAPACPKALKLSFSACMLSQSLLSFVSVSFSSVSGRVALRRTSQRVIRMGVRLSSLNTIRLLIAMLLTVKALFWKL